MGSPKQNDKVQCCGSGASQFAISVGGLLTAFCGVTLAFYVVILTAFADGFPNDSKEDQLSRLLLNVRVGIFILITLIGVAAGIILIAGVKEGKSIKIQISIGLLTILLLLTIVEILVGLFTVGGYEFEMFDHVPEVATVLVAILSLATAIVYLRQLFVSQVESEN